MFAFLLVPSWSRFWTDFESILGIQIAPKSSPKGSSKLLKIKIVFQCLLEPQKNDFWSNMARFWFPRWIQDGPQISKKSAPELIWASSWLQLDPGAALGSPNLVLEPIWHRFGVDLEPILVDFGIIFGWNLIELKKLLPRLLTYPQPRACWIMQPPQINQNHAKISTSHCQ